jgi:predicted NBD/HSP70 family sugar kinase
MAGSTAIINRVKLAIQAGRDTILNRWNGTGNITVHSIGEAAKTGDKLATEVLTDAGRYIGVALANLVNLFNPGLIILGGGVATVGDALLEPLKQTVKERSLIASFKDTRIVIGTLGREAVAIGAATLVLQEVFKGPQIALVTK